MLCQGGYSREEGPAVSEHQSRKWVSCSFFKYNTGQSGLVLFQGASAIWWVGKLYKNWEVILKKYVLCRVNGKNVTLVQEETTKSKYSAWTGLKHNDFVAVATVLCNLLFWETELMLGLLKHSLYLPFYCDSRGCNFFVRGLKLLNVAVKLNPNVSFSCFPKDSPPWVLQEKICCGWSPLCDWGELFLCMNIFLWIQNGHVAVILLLIKHL